MSDSGYNDLIYHVGHKIECVCRGGNEDRPENIAIECVTCNKVLLDYNDQKSTDMPEKEEKKSVLVLVEFNNTAPFVQRFTSKEKITMDKLAEYFESIEDMNWDKDGITIIDDISEVNLE